jgi:hypothetical protein
LNLLNLSLSRFVVLVVVCLAGKPLPLVSQEGRCVSVFKVPRSAVCQIFGNIRELARDRSRFSA